jgi:hypothetical protein
MKRHYFRCLALTFISFIALADQNQYEIITNPQTTPDNIFQIMEGLKIRAFAVDSFIKNKLDQKELNAWTSFVSDANKYVTEMVKSGKVPQAYLQTIMQLDAILNFIKETTAVLYNQKENLSMDKADSLLVQTQKYLIDARSINQKALDTINNQNPYPEYWAKNVPESFETISIKIDSTPPKKEIYTEFFETLNAQQIKSLKPQEFRTFLTNKKITNKYTIIDLLNSLEQLSYRFDQFKNNLWFKTPYYQNQLELAQILISKTKEAYPEALSQLQLARFKVNTDKVSTIIFGQSGTYMSVLGKIVNDLWKIIGI